MSRNDCASITFGIYSMAKSADAVRASYKAAIDAGATSNKEPSFRPEWHADYFAANIGDPDGYSIEIAYKPWLYK